MAVRFLSKFLHDEHGQDLIEYTLLLAFVVIGSSALFIGSGQSTGRIWSAADSRLEQASDTVSDKPVVVKSRIDDD